MVVLRRHNLRRSALRNGSNKVFNVHAASARCNDVLGRCLLLLGVADIILSLILIHQSFRPPRLKCGGRQLLKVLSFSSSPFTAF